MRKLPNWLDSFEKYMEGKGASPHHVRWAGLYTLSAALERRVWIKNIKGPLYPNMYCILVGGPGVGKSICINASRSVLRELGRGTTSDGIYLSPTSVTKPSFVDALKKAQRKIVRPNEDPNIIDYNALAVMISELGVFISEYDREFMSVLTDMWDNGIYEETRRTKDISILIESAMVNILAGTTPGYLMSFLPEGAWDQGFLSRTFLAYGDAEPVDDIFGEEIHDEKLFKELVYDIKVISRLYGKLVWEPDAAEAMKQWYRNKFEPVPDHPKLQHYNTRRGAHLFKLCMLASISCGNELVITLENYAEAYDWLIANETATLDIFRSMRQGGDGRVMEEAWHFVYEVFARKKQAVSEQRLIRFISERSPAQNVERILQIMEKSGQIKKQYASDSAGSQVLAYTPGKKSED